MNEYQQKYEMLIYLRQHLEILNTQPFVTEIHHIKMASLWPNLIDDPTNIVVLTIEEHILAHKYLMYWYLDKYGKNDGRYIAAVKAFWFMTISRDNVQLSIEDAAFLRSENARLQSEKTKGKPLSDNNRNAIIQAWNDETRRKEQSKRIRHTFAIHPEFGKKISQKNLERYKNEEEHRKSSIAGKKYFAEHPEAAIKHGNDIRDRIPVYNLSTKVTKRIPGNQLEQYLNDAWTLGIPIFKYITRGKNQGQLQIKFICPWKYDNSCYFKTDKLGKLSKWQKSIPKDIDMSKIQIVTKVQLKQYNDLVNKIINNYQ